VNSSGKESFISVHIADSGHNTLIEQRGLYRDVMPAQSLPQSVRREPPIERLGTQFADHRFRIVAQPHLSQPAPVAEDEAMPIGEAKVKDEILSTTT
jgi:hypothetical protein